jgi:hypothetical protein
MLRKPICSEALIDEHIDAADSMLFQDEKDLKRHISKLSTNIRLWAIENSKVYRDLYGPDKVFTKDDFLTKEDWYVDKLSERSVVSSTGGSTTGDPFFYSVYKKYVPFLMNEQHWTLILKEYELDKNHIKICVLHYFKDTPLVFEGDNFLESNHRVSNQSLYNHGSKNCSIDYVNFKNYNFFDWYDKLFDYFNSNDIDVIISTGPIINELCNQIRKRKHSKKLCYLLSHSNEFPLQSDFRFLRENRLVDHHCDHMRCWDGGACFFTCKFGTYHLLDNITQHRSVNKKLVTTDYFSLAAPFVNYWNGDICEIGEEYKRCKCGRLYRPFRMLQNRPFDIKGPIKLTAIKEKINKLNFKKDLVQVQFEGLNVSISTKRHLNREEKIKLKNILNDYEISINEI